MILMMLIIFPTSRETPTAMATMATTMAAALPHLQWLKIIHLVAIIEWKQKHLRATTVEEGAPTGAWHMDDISIFDCNMKDVHLLFCDSHDVSYFNRHKPFDIKIGNLYEERCKFIADQVV